MPTIDVSLFLRNRITTLEGIPSVNHPKGKAYDFASPSGQRGMWMHNLFNARLRFELGLETKAETLVLDDEQELDLYREVMGDTLQEMLDDGVSWDAVQAVFGLLFRRWGANQDIEQQVAERTESPAPAKKAAPRSEKRAPAKKAAARKAAPAKKAASRSRTAHD